MSTITESPFAVTLPAQSAAMSIFGANLTAGLALGLILGGALTSGLGWRWCLYVNVLVNAGVPRRGAQANVGGTGR